MGESLVYNEKLQTFGFRCAEENFLEHRFLENFAVARDVPSTLLDEKELARALCDPEFNDLSVNHRPEISLSIMQARSEIQELRGSLFDMKTSFAQDIDGINELAETMKICLKNTLHQHRMEKQRLQDKMRKLVHLIAG